MFKQICFFRKRPDMTMDEFMDYYENQHSQLSKRMGRAPSLPGAQRYVRRYLKPEKNPITGAVVDSGYDCLMEIWWNSREEGAVRPRWPRIARGAHAVAGRISGAPMTITQAQPSMKRRWLSHLPVPRSAIANTSRNVSLVELSSLSACEYLRSLVSELVSLWESTPFF